VAVIEQLELILQVYLDIPQNDETYGLGVMLGIISTLPGAAG
jgi:hypothetical protein